jgi:hypothetical protein
LKIRCSAKKNCSGDPHRAPKEQEEIKNKDFQSKFHQKRRRRAKNFHLIQERHLSIKLPAVQLNLLPSSIPSVMDRFELLDNAKFYSLASSETTIFSGAKDWTDPAAPNLFQSTSENSSLE